MVETVKRGRFGGNAFAGVTLAAMLALAACSSTSESATPTGTATATAAGEAPAATSTAGCAPASTATADPAAAATVLTATQAFLATLDDAQRTSVAAERTEANLAQWSNLPDELFERAGCGWTPSAPISRPRC